MEEIKKKQIQSMVDLAITSFAAGFELRHVEDLGNPEGVINKKKNNVFMAELGDEFMFYSALVRSFDSSFGNLLENLGNSIATLSYDVRDKIDSFLLDDQERIIDSIISKYDTDAQHRVAPRQGRPVLPRRRCLCPACGQGRQVCAVAHALGRSAQGAGRLHRYGGPGRQRAA